MVSPTLKGNLQPTDFADAECRVSPWVWTEGKSEWEDQPTLKGYRVWVCRCTNYWFQRHEWARADRNSTQLDEWIFCGYRHNGSFGSHMVPAPAEEE